MMERRRFLGAAAASLTAASLIAGARPAAASCGSCGRIALELPELPWAEDALEPHISAKTVGFHYGKHHAGYVTKAQKALEGSPYEGKSLELIIHATADKPEHAAIFDNVAQVWNHTFFWMGIKPGGGGAPPEAVAKKLTDAFGSVDAFREELAKAAGGQFGSGWAWLVDYNGTLMVTKTPNAGNPISRGCKPILTVDVWEHAYYLDYQNRRGDYVKAWMDNLVNWNFVAANLGCGEQEAHEHA